MRRIWSILLALLILAAPVRAAEDEKWVALTFDDGPSGALTERLLDGLAARDVKATFFVCGYRVAEYPAALRRIAAEGHEIGLHSEKHDYMQKMDYEAVLDDLTRCRARGRGMLRHAGTAVPPARRTLQRDSAPREQQIGPFADPLVGRSGGLGREKGGERAPDDPKGSISGEYHSDARSARKLGGRGADSD